MELRRPVANLNAVHVQVRIGYHSTVVLSVVCRVFLLAWFLAKDNVVWRDSAEERLVHQVKRAGTVDTTWAAAVSHWANAHRVDAVILCDRVQLGWRRDAWDLFLYNVIWANDLLIVLLSSRGVLCCYHLMVETFLLAGFAWFTWDCVWTEETVPRCYFGIVLLFTLLDILFFVCFDFEDVFSVEAFWFVSWRSVLRLKAWWRVRILWLRLFF